MEVSITSLDHQGRGIGRIENKITFVPNTIPGEIVEIQITKQKKKYMEGTVLHWIKRSNDRIENLCHYYPNCGGCQLLHLPYQKQLQYKLDKLKNIFNRYGLDNIKINDIVGSSNAFHYRNKATFHVQNHEIGFYEDNSNNFIAIDKCLLLNEKINTAIKNLPNKNKNKQITIRSNSTEITFSPNHKIIHKIGNYSFIVSINSFFQVNDYVTPMLYNQVNTYLNPNKNETVLDLYCGTGTIGIFISKNVKKVIGIEINENAIKDAWENAKINHIENIEFICGDAGIESQQLNFYPDSIIVDPPRAGLDKNAIDTIIKFSPKKLVYVSCDPMTLVRDLNILKEYYKINEVTPFDMFPNTYHVECCVLLTSLNSNN